MKLNIALLGTGRMGKEIEQLAPASGHQITARFDLESPLARTSPADNFDVLIDFTQPDAVPGNVELAAHHHKPLVIGTTGWHEHLPEVEKIVQGSAIGIIHAANFSIGMNLFLRVVAHAATLFDPFEAYDVFIHEMHHRGKADSPSGTALSLGKIVLDKIARKSDLLCSSTEKKISPEQVHLSATRAGTFPGTHVVGFDSAADTIELKHTARNRSGFAAGALVAAEWIMGKQGLFTMDDILDEKFGSKP